MYVLFSQNNIRFPGEISCFHRVTLDKSRSDASDAVPGYLYSRECSNRFCVLKMDVHLSLIALNRFDNPLDRTTKIFLADEILPPPATLFPHISWKFKVQTDSFHHLNYIFRENSKSLFLTSLIFILYIFPTFNLKLTFL